MNRYDSTTMLDDPAATSDGGDAFRADTPLEEAGAQAGETAGHLAERAAGIGLQQADRGKDQAAHGISQVADSVRRVSLDLESEQPAIASAAMTAADQVDRAAHYLQQTDAREILRSVEDMARRQPLLFLGGAFVLGVAATQHRRSFGPMPATPRSR
jgi:hypothetical protein